jgi:hypothetical protein
MVVYDRRKEESQSMFTEHLSGLAICHASVHNAPGSKPIPQVVGLEDAFVAGNRLCLLLGPLCR